MSSYIPSLVQQQDYKGCPKLKRSLEQEKINKSQKLNIALELEYLIAFIYQMIIVL